MVPNSADGELVRELIDSRHQAEHSESSQVREKSAARAEELKDHEGTEILHLDYRQGPDLPTLKYGFPDSHFICFPYETRRTGIYAAGTVHSPMDSVQAAEDGLGAAMKAVQCIEMAKRGEAVHPRAGDTSYPDFFLQRCTQCKRCTEECPFGTLNEDEKGTPEFFPLRCRRCGICMGACPERIISFQDYSVHMVAEMIKAMEVPEDYEEKPRILALMCENDAVPALEAAAANGATWNPWTRIIPIRCLGSTNIVWLAEALSRGVDGVILIGCKYGDDYQCHYVRGSELAKRDSKTSARPCSAWLSSPSASIRRTFARRVRSNPADPRRICRGTRRNGPEPAQGLLGRLGRRKLWHRTRSSRRLRNFARRSSIVAARTRHAVTSAPPARAFANWRRPTHRSPPSDPVGPVGPRRPTDGRCRPVAVPPVQRLLCSLPARGQSRRRHGLDPRHGGGEDGVPRLPGLSGGKCQKDLATAGPRPDHLLGRAARREHRTWSGAPPPRPPALGHHGSVLLRRSTCLTP